jgi:hypothetical protein
MTDRATYVLVDGENIDATLGQSILGRRPNPHERPRWDRLLQFAEDHWDQPVTGLFFLAANGELPMPFVQALTSMGFRAVPLSGRPDEKVVDIAIQRTLTELASMTSATCRCSTAVWSSTTSSTTSRRSTTSCPASASSRSTSSTRSTSSERLAQPRPRVAQDEVLGTACRPDLRHSRTGVRHSRTG